MKVKDLIELYLEEDYDKDIKIQVASLKGDVLKEYDIEDTLMCGEGNKEILRLFLDIKDLRDES